MPRIPIDELKPLPEFQMLPAGQQRFFEAYIANGYDAEAAIKAAYPKAQKPESVRVMASRILHGVGMVMLLNMHYGTSPEESFCTMVARMVMRGGISKEQESLIRLLAQTRGFVDPWSPRLGKKIEAGKSNTAARREEREPAAESQLLGDFKNL